MTSYKAWPGSQETRPPQLRGPAGPGVPSEGPPRAPRLRAHPLRLPASGDPGHLSFPPTPTAPGRARKGLGEGGGGGRGQG